MFEAFLGALFLDANKINIDNVFNKPILGPGFQVSQLFLNSVFEKYINWNNLIEINDNYKNNFQVILQKEFKNTPSYIILNYNDSNKDEEDLINNDQTSEVVDENETNVFLINQNLILNNYEMGAYLIIGYSFVTYNQINNSYVYGKDFNNFNEIHDFLNKNDNKIILFFSKGSNKIKKKAEQIACENALQLLNID